MLPPLAPPLLLLALCEALLELAPVRAVLAVAEVGWLLLLLLVPLVDDWLCRGLAAAVEVPLAGSSEWPVELANTFLLRSSSASGLSPNSVLQRTKSHFSKLLL